MKRILGICFAFLILLLCCTPCTYAADTRSLEEQTKLVSSGLSENGTEVLDGFSLQEGAESEKGLAKLVQYAKKHIAEYLSEALQGAGHILLIGFLLRFVVSVLPEGRESRAAEMAGLLAAAVIAAKAVTDFSELASETLDELHTFSMALLPTLTGAAAASGAVTSAAAKYSIAAMGIELFLNLSQNLLLPMIYALMAASLTAAVFPAGGAAVLAKGIKWGIVSILTLGILAFLLYLSLTGVIASSADTVATRVTKTVISSALPVVGSILSDAAGTVVSSIQILKTTVGSFGVIGVLAVCLIPFLRLSLRYLSFKTVAGFTDGPFGKLVSAFAEACGLLLALVSTGGIMLLISIISLMKVVSAA